MDAVIFIGICLYIVVRQVNLSSDTDDTFETMEAEDTTRVAKLNDAFYEDPDAFMDIAHALGFPVGK